MKGNSCFPRLILAAALLLSLTACAAQDTPAETDTAPLQEEPPASALQTLRADLDGDGTEDMVEYQVLESNGSVSATLALAINGVSVADSLVEQGFRLTNPHAPVPRGGSGCGRFCPGAGLFGRRSQCGLRDELCALGWGGGRLPGGRCRVSWTMWATSR